RPNKCPIQTRHDCSGRRRFKPQLNPSTIQIMTTLIFKIKILALFCALNLFNIAQVAFAGEMKDSGKAGVHEVKIEIKDFAFSPQTITVKSGEKITWINRD